MSEINTNEEPLITKMSVKGIGCKPTGGLPTDESQPNILAVIGGKANSIKMGEDGQGKLWSALVGAFRGTCLATGKSFRSGKLFLPSGIHEVVENMVKQLPADGGTVKFLLEIASVKATNPIGYSYQAVNLMPMEAETDELADLIGLMQARQQKLLAPPAPEPVKEVAAAGGKKK